MEAPRSIQEIGREKLDFALNWHAELLHRYPDLKLLVWTVDDPVVAKRLAKAGVDGITTNRPRWLREQLK